MERLCRVMGLLLAVLAPPASAAEEAASHLHPVEAVADTTMPIGEGGRVPVYLSRDWARPLPDVTRAVVVIHGRLRNADTYYRSALAAQAAAGPLGRSALMIVPQFLAGIDVAAHHLPADTLRWTLEGWEGGDPAIAPAPVSSFAVLDAILARLGDRTLFPHLEAIVVAGHSGGGQVVQRYAIAGRGDAALARQGIAVSYVFANPSSYAYFADRRPVPAIAATCAGFNDWKYGMDRRPAYLAQPSVGELERAYVARRVTYLLGTADTNPDQSALDKSCRAEAQGPYRLARGERYVATMRERDAGTPNHRLALVDGVGHDGDAMLTSACGLAALFDAPGCEAK